MKVYSFEFGTNPSWYVNEWKGAKFLGTNDPRFIGNKNFLKLDKGVDISAIEKDKNNISRFKPGSFFAQIGEFPGRHRVIALKDDGRCVIRKSNDTSSDYALAIVTLDRRYYRIVDIENAVNSEDPDEMYINPAEVVRTYNDGGICVAAIQFDLLSDNDQMYTMIIFNRIMKKYEYHVIYADKGCLWCMDYTKSDDVNEDTMDEWAKEDLQRRYRAQGFTCNFNRPITDINVCYDDEYEYFSTLIDENTPNEITLHTITVPRKAKVNEVVSILTKYKSGLKNGGKFNKAITWTFEPSNEMVKKCGFELNFIMDATGVVREIPKNMIQGFRI